ncbi:MAG: hypothetical protein HZA90_02385 [Verrucomicrobia bacterium]|nr:hypothetical protein [Verrucomicrobiota bacterium]
MAFFSTLARDGTGDFDEDGANDFQEFRAGTDPTNRASVLRVFALMSVASGHTTLLWPAAAGRAYQVQFRDSLDGGDWSSLSGTVTIAGGTASLVDATSAAQPHRFYRVLVQ